MILGHLHAQQRRIRLVRERQHLGVVAVPGNGGMMARIVWRPGPPEQLQLRITRAAVAPDAANARAGINGQPAVVNAVAALGDPGVPTVHIDNISKDALLAVGFEEPVLESNIFTGRTVLVALRPDAEPVQVTVGDTFSIDGSNRPESLRALVTPITSDPAAPPYLPLRTVEHAFAAEYLYCFS